MSANAMPAMFADFDITLQDPKERPLREIRTDDNPNGIPADTVALMQWLYDNSKRMTLSFKGEKEYEGKKGTEAANQFTNDAKDSAHLLIARADAPNGLSVTAVPDGIVVTVTVGKKRGRTEKNGASK